MDAQGFRLRVPTDEELDLFNKMAGYWCGIG
jgi:hypothetical protein